MWPHLLARPLRERGSIVLKVGVPVDRRRLEAEQIEALHRRLLVGDERQQIAAPVGRGTDDQALVEISVRVREEGREVLLVEGRVGVVALALNRGQAAIGALGDDVDADVAAVSPRPFAPAPHRSVALTKYPVGAEYPLNERLELPSAFARVGPAFAEPPVDITKSSWQGSACGDALLAPIVTTTSLRKGYQLPPLVAGASNTPLLRKGRR